MGTFDQTPANANPLDAVYTDAVFDDLLLHTCDVLEKGQSAPDSRSGQPTATLTKLVTAVACRLTTLKGGGREWEAKEKYALNDFIVFMRPVLTDDNNTAFQLSPRHWLRVYTPEATYTINLKSVNDPSGLGHHLECRGEQIIP